jgi:Ubiquitin carboxyl-terminal hydrolase
VNRLLIEALEKSLKHTSGEHLCEQLYKGLIVNQIKCLNCNNLSQREEHFYDINVQIIGCESLTSSLKQYCAAEVLEGDSAYQCDVCKNKQRALRSTVLRDLPPILTFSCNRFKIDRTTNWQRQKVTSKSAFPLLLDMSRFVEGSPGFAAEVHDVEKEVEHEKFLRGSMVWVDDVAARARGLAEMYTDKYGRDVSYKMLSEVEKDEISRTLRSTFSPSSSSSSSSSSSISATNGIHGGADDNHLYELFAAIMHCGSAHSGHYFAYIRDTLHESEWGLPEAHYKNISTDHRTRFRTRVRAVGGRKSEIGQDNDVSGQCAPIAEDASVTITPKTASLPVSVSSPVKMSSLNKNKFPDAYCIDKNASVPKDISFFTTNTGMTYIDIDSVLGLLSNIVYRAKVEQLVRERKTLLKARRKAELKARSHDKSRAPHDTVVNHPVQVEVEVEVEIGDEVLEMPSVLIKNINDLISLKLGRGSWNSLYEKDNGTIEHFTSLYGEIFSFEAESGLLTMPRYESMTWVTREILEEVYRADDRIARDSAFEAVHKAAATAAAAAATSDPSTATASALDADSVALLSCDNDAALALALQLSLNEDTSATSFAHKGSGVGVGGVASNDRSTGSDEWMPAAQKKKGGKGKSKEKDKDNTVYKRAPRTPGHFRPPQR